VKILEINAGEYENLELQGGFPPVRKRQPPKNLVFTQSLGLRKENTKYL